ncbi:Cyclopentanol dehydrogenase [Actinomadura rubteroloni]|uniref:Cyclopentanol dehydrogenase n=1 Tax=Actinomadura rubteroloni TaxID=1926885 RepID=A0A2P4UNI2_9ACTN|nr:SDR family oxidoreductase [Actinomadura rubteroloni]POM26611.1 Cyclopentanol dehydrogenase [Actinomadura rubteroloni]
MSSSLTGKTALVTGSTSGIGRAVADLLAERGAHVIVSGRDAGRGAQAVEAIRAAGGKADFVQADLTSADGARALAREASAITGRIDVLVNNAGIFPFAPTADTTEEILDTVYAVNVKAPFLLVAELAPAMAARGGGAIVNISSVVATRGSKDAVVYALSKAALDNLSRSWTAEFAASGVRVNTVSPGPIVTEGARDLLTANRDAFEARVPAGRLGEPREVAAAVAFLAADEAGFVHGANLTADGGFTAA